MNVLQRAENWIFRTPYWKLCAVLTALLLLKTGIWPIPIIDVLAVIARDPSVNQLQETGSHYLMSSYLSPMLVFGLGIHGVLGYFLFHTGLMALFHVGCLVALRRMLDDESARKGAIIFCLLPAAGTGWYWVGPDALVLVLMLMAVLLQRSSYTTLFLGVALGMQHFEMSVCGAMAILAYTVLARYERVSVPWRWAWGLELLTGIVIGKVAQMLIFAGLQVPVQANRLSYFRDNNLRIVWQFFTRWQVIVWSMLGVTWCLAGREVLREKRQESPGAVVAAGPLLVAIGILLMVVTMAADQTRVASIMSFPLLAALWLFHQEYLAGLSRSMIARMLAIWILLPYTWVWEGKPRVSNAPYTALVLYDAVAQRGFPKVDLQFPYR